jgi:hypothetical protein
LIALDPMSSPNVEGFLPSPNRPICRLPVCGLVARQ